MKILVLPDVQVRQGVSIEHLSWIGKYILDKKPDIVVCLGDFADMPSLSSHDKVGSKYFEGMRYKHDIESARIAMDVLLAPLKEAQKKQRANKEKVYKPDMHLLIGNHENRIDRAINNNPILEGVISIDDLGYDSNWTVHPFLKPLTIEGVVFNHYFPVGVLGRAAATAQTMVNKLHQSCIAGHQQGRQVAYGRKADGSAITCIIAGSCYLHDEHYMDTTSNMHWRGLVMLHEVKNGHFDEMFVSLQYLKRKYG